MRVLIVSAMASLIAAAPLAASAQGPKAGPHHPPPAAGAPAMPPGGMMQGGMMGGGMMGGGMMQGGMMQGGMMGGGMMFRYVEGRLAFLKAELKITPAQDAPWTKFADALRAAAKKAQAAMPARPPGGPMQPGSAVERMTRHEAMLAARLEAMRTIKAAFEPLYAALDEGQKKLADTLAGHVIGMH